MEKLHELVTIRFRGKPLMMLSETMVLLHLNKEELAEVTENKGGSVLGEHYWVSLFHTVSLRVQASVHVPLESNVY